MASLPELSIFSVKTRMTASNGISFAEFSYQLLQAHDFWHLYKHHDCRIQVGGSDQWGNIVAGMDVIVRQGSNTQTSEDERAYGVTTPLLVTSSGQKFGKSAGNAIWLDREKTSVFDFYQARHLSLLLTVGIRMMLY
jgi:tyrosyl-tRNA synthetase